MQYMLKMWIWPNYKTKMSTLSNPHSQRKQQDIENQKQMIEQDRNEMDSQRRFGYFSIPYPATVGDLAYTTTKEKKNYQIIDGKIKTENRNIFVAPLKKGKGVDVYFSPVEPESQLKEKKEGFDGIFNSIFEFMTGTKDNTGSK